MTKSRNDEGGLSRRGFNLLAGAGAMFGLAGAAIAGGVTLQLVARVVQPAEPLAQILQGGHQIGAIQREAAPVLQHPQTFAGAIEIGVQQPADRGGVVLRCRQMLVGRRWHRPNGLGAGERLGQGHGSSDVAPRFARRRESGAGIC